MLNKYKILKYDKIPSPILFSTEFLFSGLRWLTKNLSNTYYVESRILNPDL